MAFNIIVLIGIRYTNTNNTNTIIMMIRPLSYSINMYTIHLLQYSYSYCTYDLLLFIIVSTCYYHLQT